MKNSFIFTFPWNVEKIGNREIGSGITYTYGVEQGSRWYQRKEADKERMLIKEDRVARDYLNCNNREKLQGSQRYRREGKATNLDTNRLYKVLFALCRCSWIN